MKVKYTSWGLANRFSDCIELNKNLKKYPHLLKPILEHELSHTDKTFSIEDLKLDFTKNDKINEWDKIKFMFKYPKSLTQLLPIYWKKGKGFVYDLNLILMYLIYVAVFMSVIYFGCKIILNMIV